MPIPRIETLSLDAGGVVVFPNWDRVAATLTRFGMPVTGEALRDAEPAVKFAIDDAYRIATSTDADRWGQYFERILQRAGVADSPARKAAILEVQAYHAEHNIWEQVPDDVVPALEQLATLGVKLAITSNANGVLHRCFDRIGLTRFFDVICDSCIEGVEKPDPRFFHIVVERAGGRPETTLHVGDLYHVDVVGARRAGMQAMLIDPHDLYGGYEVPRVRTLNDLVEQLRSYLAT